MPLNLEEDFNLPYKRMVAKNIRALGASAISELVLPVEKTKYRVVKKAEDMIAVGVDVVTKDRELTRGGKRVIEPYIIGYNDTPVLGDFSQGHFALIIAAPGAGKTFLIKGLAGEFDENGYYLACVYDLKNDFYESKFPIQPSFAQHLPHWRRPRSLPMACFVPEYIPYNNPDRKIPKDVRRFQLSISDMDVEDVICALDLENRSPQQCILLRDIWPQHNPPKSVQDLVTRVLTANISSKLKDFNLEVPENAGDYDKNTRKALYRNVMHLITTKFFGDDPNLKADLIEPILEGKFLDICLFNVSGNEEMENYHTAYAYAILRKIYKEKDSGGRIGKDRRLVLVAPDIGETLLPNRASSRAKSFLQRSIISLGRAKNIYLLGDSQNLAQLPDTSVQQVQTWFIFSRTNGMDLERIAKLMKKRYSEVRILMDRYQNQLENNKIPLRGALMWQTKSGRRKFFFCSPPSSAHGLTEGALNG